MAAPTPPDRTVYIPRTPGGTDCAWLMGDTDDEAWDLLLEDAKHMPYRNRSEFIARGYTVNPWELEP